LISIAYATAGNVAAARVEEIIKLDMSAFTGMNLPTMAAIATIAGGEA